MSVRLAVAIAEAPRLVIGLVGGILLASRDVAVYAPLYECAHVGLEALWMVALFLFLGHDEPQTWRKISVALAILGVAGALLALLAWAFGVDDREAGDVELATTVAIAIVLANLFSYLVMCLVVWLTGDRVLELIEKPHLGFDFVEALVVLAATLAAGSVFERWAAPIDSAGMVAAALFPLYLARKAYREAQRLESDAEGGSPTR